MVRLPDRLGPRSIRCSNFEALNSARRRLQNAGMLTLINLIPRPEPFDHADWLFELKFDGFWAAADTVRGRLISRNGDRMQRFEGVLDLLPKGHVSLSLPVVYNGR